MPLLVWCIYPSAEKSSGYIAGGAITIIALCTDIMKLPGIVEDAKHNFAVFVVIFVNWF